MTDAINQHFLFSLSRLKIRVRTLLVTYFRITLFSFTYCMIFICEQILVELVVSWRFLITLGLFHSRQCLPLFTPSFHSAFAFLLQIQLHFVVASTENKASSVCRIQIWAFNYGIRLTKENIAYTLKDSTNTLACLITPKLFNIQKRMSLFTRAFIRLMRKQI